MRYRLVSEVTWGHPLHSTHCMSPTACHPLHATHCMLPTAYYLLHATHCMLLTKCHPCMLPTTCCPVHATHCMLPTAYHSVHATCWMSSSAIPPAACHMCFHSAQWWYHSRWLLRSNYSKSLLMLPIKSVLLGSAPCYCQITFILRDEFTNHTISLQWK